MYFKLTLRNTARNIKTYMTYFATMILAIAVFFSMQIIQNAEVATAAETLYKRVAMGLEASQMIVILSTSVLIIYINRFLVGTRKKEIGMYAILGMKNSRISYMMFVEVLILGFVGLIVGLVLGAVLSYGLMLLLFRLIVIPGDLFSFTIPMKAVVDTITFFGVLIVISAISNGFVIYRYTLIDLFKGASKGERYLKANGRLNKVMSILSVTCLGLGYILSTILLNDDVLFGNTYITSSFSDMYILWGAFALVVLGTFGFFMFTTFWMADASKRVKRRYYKDINMFVSRQMTHKVMMNAKMLAVITLLVSATIGTFSIALGFYESRVLDFTKTTAYSYVMEDYDISLESEMEEVFERYKVNNKRTFDHQMEVMVLPDQRGYVMKKSDVERLAEHTLPGFKRTQAEQFALSGDSWSVVYFTDADVLTDMNLDGQVIELEEDALFLTMAYPFYYSMTLLEDEAFEVYKGKGEGRLRLDRFINIENSKDSEGLTETLYNRGLIDNPGYHFSYYIQRIGSLSDKAALLFIGGYVGFIFLIISGSVLSVKQLTEALSDRERINSLRRIGVEESVIKRGIYKQISIVFFAPVLLTVLHMYFALGFVGRVLDENLVATDIKAFVIFMLIYSVYYLLTARSYYRLTR